MAMHKVWPIAQELQHLAALRCFIGGSCFPSQLVLMGVQCCAHDSAWLVLY